MVIALLQQQRLQECATVLHYSTIHVWLHYINKMVFLYYIWRNCFSFVLPKTSVYKESPKIEKLFTFRHWIHFSSVHGGSFVSVKNVQHERRFNVWISFSVWPVNFVCVKLFTCLQQWSSALSRQKSSPPCSLTTSWNI